LGQHQFGATHHSIAPDRRQAPESPGAQTLVLIDNLEQRQPDCWPLFLPFGIFQWLSTIHESELLGDY
jgi:hypothetical protein